MAIEADVFVSINAVNLSNRCISAPGVDQSRREQDVTAFGDLIEKMQQTLEQAPELAFVFNQDFNGGSVHATVQPLYAGKTEFNVAIRPTSAAISATNPEFQFTARVIRYSIIDSSTPGSTHKASVTLRRTSAITVDITP